MSACQGLLAPTVAGFLLAAVPAPVQPAARLHGLSQATPDTQPCEQVFDKALSEPTFSALYAQLCLHLSSELPDFTEPNEEGKPQKVTFRRIILNKCQSEFEKGAAAMTAVESREQQQAKEQAEDKVLLQLLTVDRLQAHV